jgi:hypothetical protein
MPSQVVITNPGLAGLTIRFAEHPTIGIAGDHDAASVHGSVMPLTQQDQIADTALNVPFAMTSRPGFRPISRARQGVRTPKRALDGMEPAVTTSSPRSALAAFNINGSDRIVVELVSPPNMLQVIMIRWPQHSAVVAPTRFPSIASEIARLFARASTELTRIKARRL